MITESGGTCAYAKKQKQQQQNKTGAWKFIFKTINLIHALP
jgi:hypothetical protein